MAKAWDPFKEIANFQKKINKKVGNLVGGYKKPFSNIRHSQYFVSVDVKLPGIDRKESIVLDADHTKLIVGAIDRSRASKDNRYRRVIYLPPGLLIEKAKAKFNDGLLSIYIPKSKVKKRVKIK
ncbi:MAG: Hsp20/alpha crystallin family protein [Candidatus Woesearchaeota archaeon]